MAAFDSFSHGRFEVKLDGLLIEIPPERQSFTAIHSYLELLALQQQRIICMLSVDDKPVNLTQPRPVTQNFLLVEAETMGLNEVPSRLVHAALQQTVSLRSRVRATSELVLINPIQQARELWWGISITFKEPLLTLSLLPDTICGPENGRASLTQLRQWQLQQLSCIIQEVDQACYSSDPIRLSDALERKALPWLDNLMESLQLWQETMLSDPGLSAEERKSLHS
jgi:hypothetical protein